MVSYGPIDILKDVGKSTREIYDNPCNLKDFMEKMPDDGFVAKKLDLMNAHAEIQAQIDYPHLANNRFNHIHGNNKNEDSVKMTPINLNYTPIPETNIDFSLENNIMGNYSVKTYNDSDLQSDPMDQIF